VAETSNADSCYATPRNVERGIATLAQAILIFHQELQKLHSKDAKLYTYRAWNCDPSACHFYFFHHELQKLHGVAAKL
jgi:hypothetical protein